jgi:Raf kinase inhibitor-like YbhB/YbcL family protein
MRNIIGMSAALLLASAGTASAAPFTLTSTDFKQGGAIRQVNAGNVMGCTGDDKSPALEWKNPPAGTKSFALMVHDPDAPTGGSGFWHWVVYNIPADTTSLAQGVGDAPGLNLPKGAVQGNTDMGKPGYVGPCPPPGAPKHHYNFMLYPLKVDKLDVPPGATAAYVGFSANMNSIGKPAKLTGTYARPKETAAPKAAGEKPAAPADHAAPAKPAAPPPAAPAAPKK